MMIEMYYLLAEMILNHASLEDLRAICAQVQQMEGNPNAGEGY